MTDDKQDEQQTNLDAGAYIGRKPELASETIPGGVRPADERVAAGDTQPGVPGEPDAVPETGERR
jgi:hypothetical protein